ncbi:MAG: TetR/AcrR family transcriptional regulator [Phycisphaerales bacterium]
MRVFWKKGFEGTSLPDLTKAMGINRPSLYAAFGNKESLYRKAMDRYQSAEGPGGYVACALSRPTARGVAEALLRGAVDVLTKAGCPRGCLMVNGAVAGGDDAAGVKKEVVSRRLEAERLLTERFERAKAEGDLPPSADAGDLARYLLVVLQGLGVVGAGGGRDGAREDLESVVEVAMRAWPGPAV